MARNERLTSKELIEPQLTACGWAWQEQLRIGPGRVHLIGETMYDEIQPIFADYLLRYKGVLTIPATTTKSENVAGARKQTKSRTLGSSQSMVKISGKRLCEVSIPTPSMPRQEQIDMRLDASHTMIQQLANESDNSEVSALRAAILRKAFAGEL